MLKIILYITIWLAYIAYAVLSFWALTVLDEYVPHLMLGLILVTCLMALAAASAPGKKRQPPSPPDWMEDEPMPDWMDLAVENNSQLEIPSRPLRPDELALYFDPDAPVKIGNVSLGTVKDFNNG